MLWDDYGIVSGIMVCFGCLSNSCLPSLCVSQPFTHGFPRADIHELLSPDLLHQIIKGTFKDHLVTWVTEYIKLHHFPAEANQILADIDRRQVLLQLIYLDKHDSSDTFSIAAVPSFPGLHRFPEGRGFKQWTGDDSKALMKVRSNMLIILTVVLNQTSRFIFLQLRGIFLDKWCVQ